MILKLFSMEETIKEAIDFIQQHEPTEGYFVGFSGGKDSIVVLDLVKKAKVKYEAYYTNTTIDPPEVVRFIRKEYPEVKILKPKITFWEGILKYGLPHVRRRWCCNELKKKPSMHIPLKHRIFGLRREESWQRRRFPRIDYTKSLKDWSYKPIFEWSSREIWEYIRQEKLSYCSLYDEGFARIGCIPCFFLSNPQWKRNKQRWPKHFVLLERYMIEYWKKKLQFLEKQMSFEDYKKWPFWKFKNKEEKNFELNLFPRSDEKINYIKKIQKNT